MLFASLTELEGAGMPAAAAQFCFDGRAARAAEDEMRRVEEAGGQIVTMSEDLYPDALRNIYESATGAVGAWRCDAAPPSRNRCGGDATSVTVYGAGMAEVLSRDLAAARSGDLQRHGARCGYGCAQKARWRREMERRWRSGAPAST